ncbi:HNH endonuclease [Tersicoccus phoenicis]|uniref:HNH endonuclease n=2 Tax=Tersicoccus phoenicis TaxID=554083 RepID=A0A1R1L747_9MICC|nr:HNH endonuclease [Tersicoccus phoenicis]
MAWLTVRSNDGADPLSSEDLLDFRFNGEEFRLRDRQRGIRKPRQLRSALSLTTVYRPEGANRPYEDAIHSDGRVRYKWRGTNPLHAENRALREAMRQQKPLIWFHGVGDGYYQAIYPVFLVAEEPELQQFVVATDGTQDIPVAPASVAEEALRRYVERTTLARVHQPVFRSMVMRAYETRCAVCELKHGQLLDAAHITPDSHAEGIAAVTNGLALCKIHHSAFDARILGIDPNYTVHIRPDLLDEIDGPMLRYGLQERHGQQLMALPKLRSERPDRQRLEHSFERFRAG